MDKETKKRVIEIYGPNFEETDIPAYLRKQEPDYDELNHERQIRARIEDELADDYEPEWDSCEGL